MVIETRGSSVVHSRKTHGVSTRERVPGTAAAGRQALVNEAYHWLHTNERSPRYTERLFPQLNHYLRPSGDKLDVSEDRNPGTSSWCAAFFTMSMRKGLESQGQRAPVTGTFSCPRLREQFRHEGLYHGPKYRPQKGDAIFFGPEPHHVGIVVKVQGGRVYTIEGNKDDAVRERSYPLGSSKISGYGSVEPRGAQAASRSAAHHGSEFARGRPAELPSPPAASSATSPNARLNAELNSRLRRRSISAA